MTDLATILAERGLLKEATALPYFEELSRAQDVVAYTGFDLTAPSLHVGSLLQLMIMRWVLRTGNSQVVLLGGATTQVGDPTGKDAARPVLTDAEIETNRVGIVRVFDRIVHPIAMAEHTAFPAMVNNLEWIKRISYLDFLRDYAPLFSVNRMLGMDSVRDRLERQNHMSVLEFNYSMMQAIDFLHLHETMNVNVQFGGSDQWSNILGGAELIRRKHARTAIGVTSPLFTNAAGAKMGKTAGGAIWLDPDMTSPFDFWQFWRNVEDSKVQEYLGLFTEIPMSEISGLAGDPNNAKIRLANEVTTIVHGEHEAKQAHDLAVAMFVKPDRDALPLHVVPYDFWFNQRLSNVVAYVAGISNSEAFRLVKQRAVKIEGTTVTNENCPANDAMPIGGEHIISVGKKRMFKVTLAPFD